MNIFQEVKSYVTAKQAAEQYGIRVGRNQMACCPFHDDHHPSMKIDTNYYPNLNKIQTFIHKC